MCERTNTWTVSVKCFVAFHIHTGCAAVFSQSSGRWKLHARTHTQTHTRDLIFFDPLQLWVWVAVVTDSELLLATRCSLTPPLLLHLKQLTDSVIDYQLRSVVSICNLITFRASSLSITAVGSAIVAAPRSQLFCDRNLHPVQHSRPDQSITDSLRPVASI